jgi:hypothetical protein
VRRLSQPSQARKRAAVTAATLLAMPDLASPIGCPGRVTRTGAIRPGRLGEVMVQVGGGVQAYLARDADGGSIDADEQIVVVEQVAPRTVLVTRLYEGSAPWS